MNGIYIMDVKGMRSNLDVKPVKQKFFQRMKNNLINRKKA
jgi:hypothetical protein